jgi:hypothetical protein
MTCSVDDSRVVIFNIEYTSEEDVKLTYMYGEDGVPVHNARNLKVTESKWIFTYKPKSFLF